MGQVVWRDYLNPKSGTPAIFFFHKGSFPPPLFMLVMVLIACFSFFFVGCILKGCYTFLFFFLVFSLPFCIYGGNFPRLQVFQRDYLNLTLSSPKGPFLEVRSPRRWDYAICRALLTYVFHANTCRFMVIAVPQPPTQHKGMFNGDNVCQDNEL